MLTDTDKIAALWRLWNAVLEDPDYQKCTNEKWHEDDCKCLDCVIYDVAKVIYNRQN